MNYNPIILSYFIIYIHVVCIISNHTVYHVTNDFNGRAHPWIRHYSNVPIILMIAINTCTCMYMYNYYYYIIMYMYYGLMGHILKYHVMIAMYIMHNYYYYYVYMYMYYGLLMSTDLLNTIECLFSVSEIDYSISSL